MKTKEIGIVFSKQEGETSLKLLVSSLLTSVHNEYNFEKYVINTNYLPCEFHIPTSVLLRNLSVYIFKIIKEGWELELLEMNDFELPESEIKLQLYQNEPTFFKTSHFDSGSYSDRVDDIYSFRNYL